MPKSRYPFLILCVLLLAALAGYAWQAQRARPAAPAVSAPQGGVQRSDGPPPASVELRAVERRAMPEEAGAVGTLVSNETVMLRPEVAGRIAAIHFREGAPVRRGAVLVELDAAIQEAELLQARANLTLAEANARRAADLHARRFVSQSALDDTASKLEVARAALALAEARRERMRIRAPFDGVVGIRRVAVGDYVKEGADLVNLEDIARLKVDFRLPELLLERLSVGQPLSVHSDALPGEGFAARIEAIDPRIDEQGRAVVLRAVLANPGGRLRPGLFARVRLTLAERPERLVVPEEALVPGAGGDGQAVFRIEDGRARRVTVTPGARRDAWIEIVAGLSDGDRVVVAGHHKLRDGAPVKPVPPAGPVAR